MDPTIPRHTGSGTVTGAKIGRFVFDRNDRVVLVDQDGVRYRQGYYQLLQGAFGDGTEGMEKLPRPWRYKGKKVTHRGDLVLLQFLDGDPKRPVVIGGVRQIRSSDFFHYDHAAEGADWNRVRLRVVPRDPDSDDVLGELSVHVADDFPLWRRFLRNPVGEEGPRASLVVFTDSPIGLICGDRSFQKFNDPGPVNEPVDNARAEFSFLFRPGDDGGGAMSSPRGFNFDLKDLDIDVEETFEVSAQEGIYLYTQAGGAAVGSGDTQINLDGTRITLQGPSPAVHPVVYDRNFLSTLRSAMIEAKAACTAAGLPTTNIDALLAGLASGTYAADDTRCS